MTRALLLIFLSLVGSLGVCGLDNLELKLFPVEDIYSACTQNGRLGVKVLHPRRNGVDDVIPSGGFKTYAYDYPVAALRVRNLDDVESVEIESVNGPAWLVEIATTNMSYRAPLMYHGSSLAAYVRNLQPNEAISLLVGRLTAEIEYKFRVGYFRGRRMNPDFDSSPRGSLEDNFVYSNWFQVDSAVMNRQESTAQEAAPRLSLCRLENNIRDRQCSHVKMFDRMDHGNFVDLLLWIENEEDFPIRCSDIFSGDWKLMAYNASWGEPRVIPLCCPLAHDKTYDLRLCAKECLAVPLSINMSIEDFLQSWMFKIEYDCESQHSEAEMLFPPQSEKCETFVVPSFNPTNKNQGVSIEI